MQNEEFLRFADKLPEGMLLLTSQGEILAANRKATQLLQIPAQDLLNQHFSLLCDTSASDITARLKFCARSRTPSQLSIKLLNSSCIVSSGFLFTPATESTLAKILLRIQENQSSLTLFQVLNEKINKQNRLMRSLAKSRDNLDDLIQKRTAELSVALYEAELNKAELVQKEERLSLATKPNGVGIWDYNLQTNNVIWDDSMYELYNLRKDDFSSSYEAWTQTLHPDDYERSHQEIQDAISGKKPFNTEFRVCWSNGEIHNIKAVAKVFHDDSGKPLRMLGTNIDVTERRQAEKKLKKSEERWKFALEGAGDGVWEYDFSTRKNEVSPRLMQILGFGQDALLKTDTVFNDWSDRLHPTSEAETINAFKAVLHNKTDAFVAEQQVMREDGSYIWLLTRGMVISRADNGKPLRMIGTVSDISESKKEALVKLKLAASVFTHAREAIIITDAKGRIREVNDTFTNITGYSRQEIIGKDHHILQSTSKQTPEFYEAQWHEINNNDYWNGEAWNCRKSGQEYPATLTISAVKNDIGKVSHYVTLFSDITRLKNHQDQLERMAHYDALTQLPNRTLLADRLSQAMTQCQRHKNSLAVVILDLDGFKDVNDEHGHDVGDELLIDISLRMKEVLREGDTLARIGGDEFVAVLAGINSIDDCPPLLNRLLFAASEPITVSERVLSVSASIGVTIYPQDTSDADVLMRHADQAMYLAKQAGKNCYHFFDTTQDDTVNTRRESLINISKALDNNEFVLYYQPKVNMSTGEIIGVEALIRWQHPERGLVPPIEFLPIIEGHTISLVLGEWVINTALTQISQWQSINTTLPISVNISAYQLQQTNFVTRLKMLLDTHADVPPSNLQLEILESSALTDINHVSATMHTCQTMGVDFALDDFGTGYSSLTHLRRLPAGLVKIDQSFVRDMLEDEDDLVIVEGVISLAKAFQREVIAEGVETIAHGSALLKLGCKLAQGYGIARPMPAIEVVPWMKNWKADNAWLEK
jgi:diguanylate cyclase (GGDEF)-like protein/PAS domain S-box-containing protein